MGLIFKDSNATGTTDFSFMDHGGYERAADYLVDLYSDNKISKNDRSYDNGKVLEDFGASDLEELRIKRRG